MGFGSKLKKTAKKTAKTASKTASKTVKTASKTAKKTVKTASKAKKQVQKVANTPIVKTAVTAVATTVGGEAGAQVVDNSYSVLNSDNPMDVVLGSVSSQYLVNKGYYNQFKGKSSPLSTLIPASSNAMGDFSDESISYTGVAKGLLQTANGINNTVKSAQGKRKGLIAEILSWFGF